MATLQDGTIFNFQFSARARSMKNGTEAGSLVFLQVARIGTDDNPVRSYSLKRITL